MFAYRSSCHDSTGVSPCKMMFGREVSLPVDLLFGLSPEHSDKNPLNFSYNLKLTLNEIHDIARKNMNKAADRQKHNYEHNIGLQTKYNSGDKVWYFNGQRKHGHAS